MDLNHLGNLGAFVGSVAVLVTLTYVALQIHQNTRVVPSSGRVYSGLVNTENEA